MKELNILSMRNLAFKEGRIDASVFPPCFSLTKIEKVITCYSGQVGMFCYGSSRKLVERLIHNFREKLRFIFISWLPMDYAYLMFSHREYEKTHETNEKEYLHNRRELNFDFDCIKIKS
ncbi:MAG: hypothetical protein FWG98_10280 [Candidatus Cloacimonetes bacterium]|nr:hypothetical protein [Candidatus Cloacimonadota bacterium]